MKNKALGICLSIFASSFCASANVVYLDLSRHYGSPDQYQKAFLIALISSIGSIPLGVIGLFLVDD